MHQWDRAIIQSSGYYGGLQLRLLFLTSCQSDQEIRLVGCGLEGVVSSRRTVMTV